MYIRPLYTLCYKEYPLYSDEPEMVYEFGGGYYIDENGIEVKLGGAIRLTQSEIDLKGVDAIGIPIVDSYLDVYGYEEYQQVLYFTDSLEDAMQSLGSDEIEQSEIIVGKFENQNYQCALFTESQKQFPVIQCFGHNDKLKEQLILPMSSESEIKTMFIVRLSGETDLIHTVRDKLPFFLNESQFILTYFLLGYSIEFIASNTLRSSENIRSFLIQENLLFKSDALSPEYYDYLHQLDITASDLPITSKDAIRVVGASNISDEFILDKLCTIADIPLEIVKLSRCLESGHFEMLPELINASKLTLKRVFSYLDIAWITNTLYKTSISRKKLEHYPIVKLSEQILVIGSPYSAINQLASDISSDMPCKIILLGDWNNKDELDDLYYEIDVDCQKFDLPESVRDLENWFECGKLSDMNLYAIIGDKKTFNDKCYEHIKERLSSYKPLIKAENSFCQYDDEWPF